MATTPIMITGGTGHLGFRTIRYALESGHSVRAAVRSEDKGDALKNNAALSHIKNLSDRLEIVVVPDMLQEGAWDAAIRGIKHVIHLASPIPMAHPGEDLEAVFVTPAVAGTIGILEAAKRSGTVEKVVITTSVGAIPPTKVVIGVESSDQVFGPDSRADEIPGPYPNDMFAYFASKIAALRRGEAWVQKEQPKFDVIHVAPAFVGGRDDTVSSFARFCDQGTNRLMLAPALGMSEPVQPANVIHLDDVAKAHVESLRKDITGHQTFLLSTTRGDMRWDDAKDIVAKKFPEAVQKGLFPNNGSIKHLSIAVDASKTENAFGKFKTFEEIVTEVGGQFLELQANAANS